MSISAISSSDNYLTSLLGSQLSSDSNSSSNSGNSGGSADFTSAFSIESSGEVQKTGTPPPPPPPASSSSDDGSTDFFGMTEEEYIQRLETMQEQGKGNNIDIII